MIFSYEKGLTAVNTEIHNGLAWVIPNGILNRLLENIEQQQLFSGMADCHG